MKKLYIASIASILLFTALFAGPAYAQQEINGGTTSSDLQQQTSGSDLQQQSGTTQQPYGVTDNAGAAVVQNAPNQPLDVTGAPADQSATEDSHSPFRWMIIFGLFLIVLLSPALLYARDIRRSSDEKSEQKNEQDTITDANLASQANNILIESTANTEQKKKRKKTKKNTGRPIKRSKKR